MRASFLLCTTVLLALSAAQATGQPYGVGFGLSFDYGTVSVYYENGTSAAVAKVEGGPDYKRTMASQNWTMNYDQTITLSYELQQSASQHPISARIQSWRDYVPPWLGGRPLNPDATSLYQMLRALRAASEAYTSSQATSAIAVFPAHPPQTLLKALGDASARLGLDLLSSSAGQLAAVANGIGSRYCYNPPFSPEQLVLSVEWSRASLNAMLYTEECGVFEEISGTQDTDVGRARWSSSTHTSIYDDIRSIVQLPVETPDNTLDKVSKLVLLGESGNDPKLRSIVMELFGEYGAVRNNLISPEEDHEMVDPLFAASIGAAMEHVRRAQNPRAELGPTMGELK